jgi:hypothetical protein
MQMTWERCTMVSKGRSEFTHEEISRIRQLLQDKQGSPRDRQKVLRAQLRLLGFYITDFGWSGDAFSTEDLDQLIRANRIRVTN